MAKFKVCSITRSPEQFKVEMEAVFGSSTILMQKIPKAETSTMIHLGFTLQRDYTIAQLYDMIPSYVPKHWHYEIILM